MCGIAAIFAYHPDAPPVDRDELLRMRERMRSRGPDGSGLWLSDDGRIGLAHRRLSIIDLSEAGAQPMTDPATGNVIVFNGEIYNYRELRRDLEAKGHQFRSTSDTEVLLKLYAAKGPDMVRDLRGMYAFAIYTPSPRGERAGVRGISNSLFLARDPYGIKPLYLHDDGKTLRLASQVKALLAGGGITPEAELAGHAGFFLWGHVPEPFTLYKGIKALAPGARLEVSRSALRVPSPTIFCSIPEEIAKAESGAGKIAIAEASRVLREALCDTVRAHLVADVPVGVFLSAGLDSTTIAALAAQTGAELHTVTLGFEEYRGTPDDEVVLAEQVARQYGARHQTVWVTKNEFRAECENLLKAMDQPTIDGVNTYFVSLAARKAGLKVALSGLGGDELFGGYPSFRQIPKSVRALGWTKGFPWFGKGLREFAAPFACRFTSPKYAGLFEYGGSYAGAYLLRRGLYLPWELPRVMDAEMAREGLARLQTLEQLGETEKAIASGTGKVTALESTWYMRNQLLRDTDWAGMAHSLEVRVPLVDLTLLRSVASLVASLGPAPKKAMALVPHHPLPKSVLNRRKSGFTVPTREWLLPPGASMGKGSRQWARVVYAGLRN